MGQLKKPPLNRITVERLSAHKAAKAYPWDWLVEWPLHWEAEEVKALSRWLHKVNRAALGCRYYRWTCGVRRAWDFYNGGYGPVVILLVGDVADLDILRFQSVHRRIAHFKGAETLRDNIPARALRKMRFTITGGPFWTD